MSNDKTVSNWESYLSNVNGSIASIFLDLELVLSSPKPELPKLAWLWIKLKHPLDNGLSRDDEFNALCNYEDELQKFIGQNNKAIYVGRITTLGRREFYFYVDENIKFQTLIDSFLQSHQDYPFQLGETLDPLWDHYSNCLYPGEEGLSQIKNRKEKN